MDFIALTLGLVVLLVLVMFGLARAFESHRAADFLDWKPTRSPEVEAQNEVDDVRQMIEAQNEYRRKRGAKEITEEDVERQAREDQAVRARGRGPFAEGGGLDEPPESEPRPKRAASAKRKPAAKRNAARRTAAKRSSAKRPTKKS